MAVYIDILRDHEDDTHALYRFELTDGRSGELRIEKETGEITLTKKMEGDTEGFLFARASRKVWLAWESGKFPGKLVWAS